MTIVKLTANKGGRSLFNPSTRYFAGLVNKTGNHWCLLFVNIDESTFTNVDPLFASSETVDKIIKDWTEYAASDRIIGKMVFKYKKQQFTKQTDSFNCGAIVAKCFKSLIDGIYSFEDDNYSDFRNDILAELSQTSLN